MVITPATGFMHILVSSLWAKETCQELQTGFGGINDVQALVHEPFAVSESSLACTESGGKRPFSVQMTLYGIPRKGGALDSIRPACMWQHTYLTEKHLFQRLKGDCSLQCRPPGPNGVDFAWRRFRIFDDKNSFWLY